MKAIFATLLLFTCVTHLHARKAGKYWYPDELTDKSTLVCDGLVLDVTGPIPNPISSKNLCTAKIKVLSVLKGAAVDTLEFRYHVVFAMNGPRNLSLRDGEKWRFYLSKDPRENYYWGCLEGDYAEAQSVGPIPDSAEDAKLRLNEIMNDGTDVQQLYRAALLAKGKAGYEEARDSVVAKVLKLVLMCESLKKADTDQKQVRTTEDFYIDRLADSKDPLFPEPNDTSIFDKLIRDDLLDPTIRAYVTQRMITEWDHPND